MKIATIQMADVDASSVFDFADHFILRGFGLQRLNLFVLQHHAHITQSQLMCQEEKNLDEKEGILKMG